MNISQKSQIFSQNKQFKILFIYCNLFIFFYISLFAVLTILYYCNLSYNLYLFNYVKTFINSFSSFLLIQEIYDLFFYIKSTLLFLFILLLLNL